MRKVYAAIVKGSTIRRNRREITSFLMVSDADYFDSTGAVGQGDTNPEELAECLEMLGCYSTDGSLYEISDQLLKILDMDKKKFKSIIIGRCKQYNIEVDFNNKDFNKLVNT